MHAIKGTHDSGDWGDKLSAYGASCDMICHFPFRCLFLNPSGSLPPKGRPPGWVDSGTSQARRSRASGETPIFTPELGAPLDACRSF